MFAFYSPYLREPGTCVPYKSHHPRRTLEAARMAVGRKWVWRQKPSVVCLENSRSSRSGTDTNSGSSGTGKARLDGGTTLVSGA